MKDINAAYEEIMRLRSGMEGQGSGRPSGTGAAYDAGRRYNTGQSSRAGQSGGGQGYGSAGQSGNPYGADSAEMVFRQIRIALNSGNFNRAEALLNRSGIRNAEWFFLRGILYSRRGWMDDALQSFRTAVSMDPYNAEYRQALDRMERGPAGAYRPGGGTFGTTSCCDGDLCLPLCCAFHLLGNPFCMCC